MWSTRTRWSGRRYGFLFFACQFSSQQVGLLRSGRGRRLKRAAASGPWPLGTCGERPPNRSASGGSAPSHSSALSSGSSRSVRARARCAATANISVQRWPAACRAAARSHGSAVGGNPPFRHQSARPPRPRARPGDTLAANGGYVAWRFRRAASAAALPGTRSAPARAAPSRPTGLTKVVSTVAWAPCHNGSPFACDPLRRPGSHHSDNVGVWGKGGAAACRWRACGIPGR